MLVSRVFSRGCWLERNLITRKHRWRKRGIYTAYIFIYKPWARSTLPNLGMSWNTFDLDPWKKKEISHVDIVKIISLGIFTFRIWGWSRESKKGCDFRRKRKKVDRHQDRDSSERTRRRVARRQEPRREKPIQDSSQSTLLLGWTYGSSNPSLPFTLPLSLTVHPSTNDRSNTMVDTDTDDARYPPDFAILIYEQWAIIFDTDGFVLGFRG